MAKVLIILGMHRSGTSMLTQWLNACGLNTGVDLQKKSFSNKFGHFEDYDFFNYHNALCRINKIKHLRSPDQEITIPGYMVKQAKKLLDDRKDLDQWSWKDPKTCLFLDLWYNLLPDAYSIIIYRHYDEVVDSLYRRESAVKKRIKRYKIPIRLLELISYRVRKQHYYNKFLETWIRYNNDLLSYIEKRKNDDNGKTLVCSVDDLITNSEDIYNTLTNKWGFRLSKISINDVFSENFLKRKDGQLHSYDPLLEKSANEILQKFELLKNQNII